MAPLTAQQQAEQQAARMGIPDWMNVMTEKDDCNADCGRCMPQFMPIVYFEAQGKLLVRAVDDDAAQEELTELVRRIRHNREIIRTALADHGDAILAMWKKKTRVKRQEILLAIEPDLYLHKWPDLRAEFGLDEKTYPERHRSSQSVTVRSPLSTMATLLPYLNVEQLKEDPMKLLSLLHHRSAGPPEDWVYFDAEQLKSAWLMNRNKLFDQYSERCVVMHGADYGKLVPWNRAKCHGWIHLGYGLARAVLQAQDMLYNFLASMAKELGGPMTTEGPGQARKGGSQWRRLKEAGFKLPGQVAIGSPYSNQAFAAPPKFDPSRYLEDAKGLLAAAQDDLQFLQTDPQYLHYHLRSRIPVYETAQAPSVDFWERFARDMIALPIQNVRLFNHIVDQLQYVVELHEKLHANLRPFEPLPAEYEHALSDLQAFGRGNLPHYVERIRLMLPRAPGFSGDWRPAVNARGEKGWQISERFEPQKFGQTMRTFYLKDKLHWALYKLGQNASFGWVDVANKAYYLGFIEDHLEQADRAEKSRLDQQAYDDFARMIFHYQLLEDLTANRPGPRTFDVHEITPEEEQRVAMRYMEKKIHDPTPREMDQLAPLLQAFYETPWPKGKRDRAWLETVTLIRERQAAIWKLIRQAVQASIRSCYPQDIEAELQSLSADQSVEHRQEVEAERQIVLDRLAAKSAKKSSGPFEVQTVWGPSSQDPIVLPVGRSKAKTRPESGNEEALHQERTAQNSAAASEANEPPTADAPPIPVRYDSMLVLSKLFPSNNELGGKSVKWQQFVAAMADAGFSATHTGGSAVTFAPVVTPGHSGSIVFHKPHPDPELDPVMLHAMGKRMHKWFGWDRNSFVEREKAAKAEEKT